MTDFRFFAQSLAHHLSVSIMTQLDRPRHSALPRPGDAATKLFLDAFQCSKSQQVLANQVW